VLVESIKHRQLRHFWSASKISISWLVIAFFAIGISISMQFLSDHSRFQSGDEWLRDHFAKWQMSQIPEERITLIDIDEASIAQVGNWPWSRTQIADLIEKLISTYEPKGIALDIFFSQKLDPAGDSRLAILAEHAPVVFAQAFDFKRDRFEPWQIGTLSGAVNPQDFAIDKGQLSRSAKPTGFLANHQGLANAKYTGNIGFVPDFDGTLRRVPGMITFNGQVYAPLAVRLFDCCAKSAANPVLPYAKRRLSHVDEDGFFRVKFGTDLGKFRVISASNVLQETTPIAWVKDRLIIIGSSSLTLSDRISTPLNASTNGFLVHAEILSELLNESDGDHFFALPGNWIAIFFTVCVVALGMLIFRKYSALLSAAMLALASGVWLFIAYRLSEHDMWFSPAGPLMANFFLLAVAVPFAWQTTQQRSRHLLDTLNQYVAKSVVKELLRSDLDNPLAPRQSYVTTLIADMAGYTSHVEHLSMEEAASLTRDFLECLTGPVLEQGGTLDKYTGDGLVAFWGAPLPIEDHADRALNAAIQMIRNIANFNKVRASQGKSVVRARIGIESGLAIAGDFGSSHRSIYTAVGDSVNTASRLEDAARHYPYDIIVGKGTVDSATQHRFILIGEKMLRGKEKPTLLYTVELPE